MSVGILLLLLAVLVLLEMPLAFALPASALIYLALDNSIPGMLVVQRVASGLESYVLLAIPLFVFAGNLFNRVGIAERIFDFANRLMGHIKGGLAHVNIFASVIFSGMSGVAQADAAGLGSVEVRAMKKAGYTPAFSGAITAASAVIGPIIPPSGIMIIYAVLANVSVPELFLAGFIPGILMAAVLMLTVYLLAHFHLIRAPRRAKAPIGELARSFLRAFPSLMAPALLIGGILIGFATPTELGALTVFYALILGLFYRKINWPNLRGALIDTVTTCGVLVFIIAAATPLSAVLAIKGVPHQLAEFLLSFTDNKFAVLAIINIALLVFGCFMDTTAILLIVVPVLAPLIVQFGIDPVHFGLIIIINLLLGTLTPPFGILLFVTMEIAKVRMKPLVLAVAPFYLPLLLFLILITYIPQLSLWLPHLFFSPP